MSSTISIRPVRYYLRLTVMRFRNCARIAQTFHRSYQRPHSRRMLMLLDSGCHLDDVDSLEWKTTSRRLSDITKNRDEDEDNEDENYTVNGVRKV